MRTAMVRGDARAFTRRLDELKEAGSVLLVTGENASARSAVSAQLLGDHGSKRYPVFALLGRDRSVVADRFQAATSVGDEQIIEYEFNRSAARSTGGSADQPARRLESLTTLLEEVTAAVEAVVTRTDEPLSPGELRVCVDSMTPAVDGFERQAVESFVADLRTTVRGYGGLAHVLLPLTGRFHGYDWIEEAFDGVVEARTVGGLSQERWRLPSDGLVTDWFAVDEVGVS